MTTGEINKLLETIDTLTAETKRQESAIRVLSGDNTLLRNQADGLHSEVIELKQKLSDVVDACEDKNGQFSAWHKHLRTTTQAAKLTLARL